MTKIQSVSDIKLIGVIKYTDMNIHTFIVFTIILVLLGILLIISSGRESSQDAFPKIWNISYPLTILDNSVICTNGNNIVKYCDSWGYSYSPTNIGEDVGYTLVINEPVSDINMGQSLSFLMSLATNVEFIAFNNCSDYIIRNDSQMTQEKISEQIDNIDLPYQLLINILSEGYPRIIGKGVLLHRSYLDSIFRGRNISFNIPAVIPSFIPRRSITRLNNISKIPKIIHQTFQTRLIPRHIMKAVDSWLDRNPDYDYYYYDDGDQRKFIQENFKEDVLRAYDKLIPGAYKADLWRYCVIYIKGGVYIDVKMGPYVPLDRMIDNDTDLVVVNDTHGGTLYNAFFAATSQHPAILNTIEIVVERVLKGEYGDHILYPTGPMAMGHAILPMYGYMNNAPNGKHSTQLGVLQVYSHISRDGWTYITDINGNYLIRTRYSKPFGEENYLHKITGSPHYRFLWRERAIYRQ